MATNKDGFAPGQKLTDAELQQYLNRKRQEARNDPNKPAAKRPGRAKSVETEGEQSASAAQASQDS